MERSMFSSAEVRLAKERRLKYQGTAKIDISQISLPSEYKQDNVERLRGIFEKDGCDRLSLRNHVIATISKENLMSAVRDRQTNLNSLMSQPSDNYAHLDFPTGQVVCLHGQHRLRAGREFLAPYDRWWTVDLYLDDISRELQTELTDEYSNEATPNDGEVYRKVRQYQYEASARFEERWLARLTPNKQKRMRQLSQPENTSIRSAFDALLPIPGLWKAMSIGNLPRIIALKCDEEIIHYLGYVKEFWSSVVGGDRSQMEKIDYITVKELQLLVPGGLDRKKVKGLVLSGEAFSQFDHSERRSIWRALRGRKEIIPSLHTFFKDISYLETCANCLKRLIDLSEVRQPTMHSAMKQIYDPAGHVRGHYQIQESETGFRQCSGTVEEGRAAGYRQLWLFAFRHYLKMPKAPKKSNRLAKAKFQDVDPRIVHRMATLANQLGFHSPKILQIIQESPDRQLALATLLKARERDYYRYHSIESLVNRMVECFDTAVPIESQSSYRDVAFPTVPRRSRCGKPCVEAHEQERKFLFFDHMEDLSSNDEVSALFVRRCVYFAFFGKPSEPSQTPMDEDISTSHHSAGSSSSPLFFPEEYNSLDGVHVAGSSDHDIDRPHHRTDQQGRQYQGRRREERRRRRQEREIRRSQRREWREHRRQQSPASNGGSGIESLFTTQDRTGLSDDGASTLGDMNELDILNEYERGSIQLPNIVVEDAEESMDLRTPLEPVHHIATEQVIAGPAEVEGALSRNLPRAEADENTKTQEEVVAEPTLENTAGSLIDKQVGSNHPREEIVPPLHLDDGEVLVEEDDTLPDLPSDDRVANNRVTLGPRKKQIADRRSSRPLGIKKTAVVKRRAAERARLAGVNAASAGSPLLTDRPITQLDFDRMMESTEQEKPEESAAATSPGVENPTETLVAQRRANTLAQLENSESVPQPISTDHLASPQSVPPPSMQNFIDRLRESPSPEGDNRDTIPETRGPQPDDSHGEQPENNIDTLPAETTAPVSDAPAERDVPQDAPEEPRRKIPAERKAAEDARRGQEAKKRAENAQRAVEESKDSFTRTGPVDDLFSDKEDDEGEDHISPDDDPIWESPAGLASQFTPEHGEDDAASSTRPLARAGRKRFARTARHTPYQRPSATDEEGPARPPTQIDIDGPALDSITAPREDQPSLDISPIDPGPSDEVAATLHVPDDRGNDRRRKAAHKIRQQRSPGTPIAQERPKHVVTFWVWTGVRWIERAKVDLRESDPRRVEREANRFVEHYHTQLRDARMRRIMPVECLESARDDGSQSVFVIFPEDGAITEAMEKAAAKFINPRPNRQPGRLP